MKKLILTGGIICLCCSSSLSATLSDANQATSHKDENDHYFVNQYPYDIMNNESLIMIDKNRDGINDEVIIYHYHPYGNHDHHEIEMSGSESSVNLKLLKSELEMYRSRVKIP